MNLRLSKIMIKYCFRGKELIATLVINSREYKIDEEPDTPLLWVLREKAGLTGTKFGCGKGLCGACTVHLDGKAVNSCTTTLKEVLNRKIITIEGISSSHPIMRSWREIEVSQCGYCQPGQIMKAIALLNEKTPPSDSDIDMAMSANLCRCGTYQRIRRAIHLASKIGHEK